MNLTRLWLCLVLCVGSVQAAPLAAKETIPIEVRHLPDHAGWEVRYRLAEPADRLQFFGDFLDRRRERWQITTPGLQWQVTNDERGHPHEAIVATQGSRVRTVTLRFASDDAKLPQHVPLNQRFSDGSEWLCTTYLYAGPIRLHQAEREARMRLHFVPKPGESISLLGQRHSGTTSWTDLDANLRGTYVYFGNLSAAETPAASVIVDPALPPYLHELFTGTYPEVLAYFAERTGFPLLTRHTTVLITYQPDDTSSRFAGDGLPGSIDLNFFGPSWAEDRPESRRQALAFIAHESAHLWNGGRFDSRDGDNTSWLHEGGAEAFAWLALRHFGLLDTDLLKDMIEGALNRCLADWPADGTTLKAAFEQQHRYALGYSCGAVMQLLTDAELRGRGGLFAVWHSMFTAAGKTANRYTPEQYFEALESLASNDRLSTLLKQLWNGPLPDPAATFVEAMRVEGIKTSTANAQPEHAAEAVRKAMAALMAEDCLGSINFNSEADGFLVGGLPACKAFRSPVIKNVGGPSIPGEGEDGIAYKVVGLVGQPVIGDSAAVYSAISAQCAAGEPVEARLGDGSVIPLACTKPLPALPPYFKLSNWPEGIAAN